MLNSPKLQFISDSRPELKTVLCVPALFAAFAAFTASAFAQSPFAGQEFAVGTTPTGILVDDFTGDGRTDLVTANYGTPSISLLAGDGLGNFTAQTMPTVTTYPHGIGAVDLNLDGRKDITVVHLKNPGVLTVLLANASGGFNAGTTSTVGSGARSVSSADFNADGKPDVVSANFGLSNITVLNGNGAGGFSGSATYGAGSNCWGVNCPDLNNDGRPDLAISNAGGSSISILLNNGSGGFALPVHHLVGAIPKGIVSSDFTQDGFVDVAVASQFDHNVAILAGNGTGALGAPVYLPVSGEAFSLASGDLNGDGFADLVTANYSSHDASVLLANGAGGFLAAKNYYVCDGPLYVAMGHINSDGVADLAFVNYTTPGYAVVIYGDGLGGMRSPLVYNSGQSPSDIRAGDLNGDGAPDLVVTHAAAAGSIGVFVGNGDTTFAPVATFSAGNQPTILALSDVNADGALDAVVSNWGADRITILPGNGNATFSAIHTEYATGTLPRGLAVADVTDDGAPDLVYSNYINDTISIRAGAAGIFSAPVSMAAPLHPYSLQVADLNGDGSREICVVSDATAKTSVFVNSGGGVFTVYNYAGGSTEAGVGDLDGDFVADILAGGGSSMTVFHGSGNALFVNSGTLTAGTVTHSPLVSDFDGDGRADIAVSNETSNGTVSVRMGTGAGAFGPVLYHTVRNNPRPLVACDFNNDGAPDLAAGCYVSGDIVILKNLRGGVAGLARFGTGSPGCAGNIGLGVAIAPAVNTPNFGISAVNVPPLALGLLLIGDAANAAGADYLGVNILLHIDLLNVTELIAGDIYSDANGIGYIPAPIPNDPQLANRTYVVQAIALEWGRDGANCNFTSQNLVSSPAISLQIAP